MSNALYDNGRNEFAKGNIAWKAGGGSTIKVVACTSGYTPNLATDTALSNIAAGNRVATGTLVLADPSAGVCDANDITFSAVTGSQITQLIIYKDTGVESTSTLIAKIDTATNLPVTPNGGDITIAWDSGTNRIFKL